MIHNSKIISLGFWLLGSSLLLGGAPRSGTLSTQTLSLKELNIMTYIPCTAQESATATSVGIHSVCKRIHSRCNVGAINTVVHIDQDEEQPRKLRIMSGVYPVAEEVIFVYASPWSGRPGSAHYKYNGNGAYTAYLYQKSQIIPGVCVCFDHPTHTRTKASFGQALDQECLKQVLHEVRRVNPHAAIVLVGPCAGSMTILNFISQHPDELTNVKAVILESPSISIEHIEQHVMAVRLGAFGRKLPRFFKYWFSSYNPQALTILDTASAIPHDLPILIGALKQDKTASYEGVKKIVQAIQDGGNHHVYFYTHADSKVDHGKMGKTQEWPQVVNAFLHKHGLPHVAELAREGTLYLSVQ